MFYPVHLNSTSTANTAKATVALTPAESKRLLGKAVAALPEVQCALRNGRLLISGGTTNAFVAEELLGVQLPKFRYAIGVIADGALSVTDKDSRLDSHFLYRGQRVEMDVRDFLKEMGAGDVVVKGGNAVDSFGHAGVLAANETGGTIGAILGISSARGLPLLMPVGLEKLIPSVVDAAAGWGQLHVRHSTGIAVALIPVVNALVLTEVQALGILAGVAVRHIASGGVGGSEGSVVLLVEGSEEAVDKAFALVRGLKGEPPILAGQHKFSK